MTDSQLRKPVHGALNKNSFWVYVHILTRKVY